MEKDKKEEAAVKRSKERGRKRRESQTDIKTEADTRELHDFLMVSRLMHTCIETDRPMNSESINTYFFTRERRKKYQMKIDKKKSLVWAGKTTKQQVNN